MQILSRRLVLALPFGAIHAEEPSWRARVAGPSEPGERLIITGRILRANATAAGTVLTMYQTDAKGIYGSGQGHPSTIARLRGKLTAGPKGQYEIETIKPGNYPGGGVPAHIHLVMNGRELPEFLFAGDKYIKGGEHAYVLQLKKDSDGRWRATQDITITP